MTETILVVDDEESVRRTFREWLEGASLGCRILLAEDAETALHLANEQRIDLAILDWNLGAGNDGLKLLEDLQVFHPDVVAIMVTGFADQATPVQAMRMGVRDYLDKNQDLNRTNFLRAVRNQLDRIRPARRERLIQQGLGEFRTALEKILPLVETTTTLHDPVPFAEAARSILRSLVGGTQARSGYLILLPDDGPPRVWNQQGESVAIHDAAGRDTLATLALTLQGAVIVDPIPADVLLHSFEVGHAALLAVPLTIHTQLNAVVELFPAATAEQPLSQKDRHFAALLAPLATDLLRQCVAERPARQLLLDAIRTALESSRSLVGHLDTPPRPEDPPPAAILDTIRQGLPPSADSGEIVQLAEAIRELSVRHGTLALRHCRALVESLRSLLDQATGTGEPPT